MVVIVLVDVQTGTLGTPSSSADVGMTARNAEVAKRCKYETRYVFPNGVEFHAIGIDSYGRMGPEFVALLKNTFKIAARLDRALYNTLITKARNEIAVANTRAVTNRILRGMRECIVRPEDRERLMSRVYGVSGMKSVSGSRVG
jgi:hypothetical protein